jgi:hypothetical protein
MVRRQRRGRAVASRRMQRFIVVGEAPASPTTLEWIGVGEVRSQLRRNGGAGSAHRRGEVTTAAASTPARGGSFRWSKVDKGCCRGVEETLGVPQREKSCGDE